MAKKKGRNPAKRDKNKKDTLFGGLTGKAERAMKGRKSRIDKATKKATGK